MNKTEVAGLFGLSVVGASVFGAGVGDLIHREVVLGPAQDNLDCAEELASNTNHDTANLPEACSERDLSKYITGPDTKGEVWRTDAGGRLSKIDSTTINYGSTEKIVTDAKSNLEAVRAEQDPYTVTGGLIGLGALVGICVAWRLYRKHRYGVHSEVDSQDVERPNAPFKGPVYPSKL